VALSRSGRRAPGRGDARVVVLRALGLGDLLTAVPALRALARAFPRHRLQIATPRGLAGLVDWVDVPGHNGRARRYEVVHASGLGRLDPALSRADLAVNLHGRGPQSHRLLLETSPGRLIAFGNPATPHATGPPWRDGEHEVVRWCRLLREHGIPADPSDLDLAPPAGQAPAEATGATLLHPGAASPARRWPLDRWVQVALGELAQGRRVAITGSGAERPLALELARRAGLRTDAVLAGRTDVCGLARAVAAADRVACGDTGVAHLATALGTPSVILFGPTPPTAWGPPAERRQHRVLWDGRPGDPHGGTVDPGLLRLPPHAVSEALQSLPAGRP
jgi:ADP-heptose:LPS heptosyltransferase